MTEEQIKYMANRFLMWKLPANFNPDGGISFDPIASKGTPHEFRREPVGTNLIGYTEAVEMVRHMIDGLPITDVDELAALRNRVSDLELQLEMSPEGYGAV